MIDAWTLVIFWRLWVRAWQLRTACIESAWRNSAKYMHFDSDSVGMFQLSKATWQ